MFISISNLRPSRKITIFIFISAFQQPPRLLFFSSIAVASSAKASTRRRRTLLVDATLFADDAKAASTADILQMASSWRIHHHPLGVLLIIFHGLMYFFRFRALASCNELLSIGELGIPCLPDHIASNIFETKAIQSHCGCSGIIWGAKGKFSGGFDITAFGGLTRGKVAAPKPSFVSVEILTDIVEAIPSLRG